MYDSVMAETAIDLAGGMIEVVQPIRRFLDFWRGIQLAASGIGYPSHAKLRFVSFTVNYQAFLNGLADQLEE